MTTWLDLDRLDDLREQVLVPAARSLLSADELEDCWVSFEPLLRPPGSPEEWGVWARVLAGGEVWATPIWFLEEDAVTYATLAERIVDGLQEWICETSFGWGQWREPR